MDETKYFMKAATDFGSPKESVLTVGEYAATAKEMGSEAAAVTDITMYGIQPAVSAFQKVGVKLVVGLKLFVCEDKQLNDPHPTYYSLTAYAKDMDGYHILCRLSTAGQDRMLELPNGRRYPTISKAILEKYVGPKSIGHGHVILLSGGVDGVVTGLVRANLIIRENVKAIEDQIGRAQSCLDLQSLTEKELEDLEKKRAEEAALSKKVFTVEKRQYAQNPTPEAKKAIEDGEVRVQQAKTNVQKIRRMMTPRKTTLKSCQEQMEKDSGIPGCTVKLYQKWLSTLKNRRDKIAAEKLDPAALEQALRKEAQWYQNLAGKDCWYLELQNHGRHGEKTMMFMLCRIAVDLKMPLVATNEAFMASKEDLEKKKYINSLFENSWEDPTPEEAEMYLKSDAELFKAIKCVAGEKYAKSAMENRKVICDACNVSFKKDPQYPKYPCDEISDADLDKELNELCGQFEREIKKNDKSD